MQCVLVAQSLGRKVKAGKENLAQGRTLKFHLMSSSQVSRRDVYCHHYTFFVEKETEAQKGVVTLSESQSKYRMYRAYL